MTATSIKYDRAGRSTGTAFVTYERESSAQIAIREYDRANANGQPIYLTMMPGGSSSSSGGTRSRNPFDTAQKPSRSIFDRITAPGTGTGPRERFSRSVSPDRPRLSDVTKPPPEGIDRYVPGGQSQRVRSPLRSNRSSGGGGGGRSRPERRRLDGSGGGGGRRDEHSPRNGRGGSGAGGAGGLAKDGRPRKTQEELDAEMEDYWGSNNTQDVTGGGLTSTEPFSGVANRATGPVDVDFQVQQAGMVGEDGDTEMIG